MALTQFIIAILATYRLAHLLPEDDGPFFVFTRIRSFVDGMAMNENDNLGIWNNIDSGINCIYCCGLYAAIICTILALWQNYYVNVFLLILAIAGGQSLLQRWSEK
jgi:hypothetical protein